jgi:hypothetical protein
MERASMKGLTDMERASMKGLTDNEQRKALRIGERDTSKHLIKLGMRLERLNLELNLHSDTTKHLIKLGMRLERLKF